MKCLLKLAVDDNIFLKIEIPEHKKKQTLYYKPRKKLSRFDIATVSITCNNKALILFEDILQEAVHPFINTLKIAMDETEDDNIEPGNFGKIYNIDSYEELYAIAPDPLVWDYKGTATFIYKVKSIVYLEIAPIYPWLSYDPDDDPHYIPFEEYMKNYEPNMVIEISQDTIQAWITQCKQLMEKVT